MSNVVNHGWDSSSSPQPPLSSSTSVSFVVHVVGDLLGIVPVFASVVAGVVNPFAMPTAVLYAVSSSPNEFLVDVNVQYP